MNICFYLYISFFQWSTNYWLSVTTVASLIFENEKLMYMRIHQQKILKISTPLNLSPLTYLCKRFFQWVFTDTLKYWEMLPLFKAIDQTFLITGQFPYLPPFLKLLERLYTKDYMII